LEKLEFSKDILLGWKNGKLAKASPFIYINKKNGI
jgi:hypothetical protein